MGNVIDKALTLLSCMAVHVSLQGAGSSKALIADLALVLLLGARRHFGTELSHHGLWGRWRLRHEVGSWQRP